MNLHDLLVTPNGFQMFPVYVDIEAKKRQNMPSSMIAYACSRVIGPQARMCMAVTLN